MAYNIQKSIIPYGVISLDGNQAFKPFVDSKPKRNKNEWFTLALASDSLSNPKENIKKLNYLQAPYIRASLLKPNRNVVLLHESLALCFVSLCTIIILKTKEMKKLVVRIRDFLWHLLNNVEFIQNRVMIRLEALYFIISSFNFWTTKLSSIIVL